MNCLKPLALLVSLLALSSCNDSKMPIEPQGRPHATSDGSELFDEQSGDLLADTVHTTLKPPFAFLSPLAPRTALPGEFDPSLAPVVEICDWAGTECQVPPLARYTTTTGPGSETVRVSAGAEGHYLVNWHTGRFTLDPTRVYRIRVLLGTLEIGATDVRVVSGGGESSDAAGQPTIVRAGQSLPIRFWIQKVRRLTVVRDDGVRGTLIAQDTLYAYGTRLTYDLSAAEGYQNLRVLVNDEEAPSSGTLVMDRDRLLIASAEVSLVLAPGDENLVRSARAILTAEDKVAAFQVHLDQIAELFERVGPEEASRRVQVVEQLAYDVVADSAAIRRTHEALGIASSGFAAG
jgi:hypothetical protein